MARRKVRVFYTVERVVIEDIDAIQKATEEIEREVEGEANEGIVGNAIGYEYLHPDRKKRRKQAN